MISRVISVLAGLFLLAATFASAHAASCAPGWSDAGNNICERFAYYTGTIAGLVVPSGITQLTVYAAGAEGGPGLDDGYTPSPGGLGGRQRATVPVTPGETLMVIVGGAGGNGPTGGFAGGGPASSNYGGRGGGGSFVFNATGALLIAAGGGGGGGYDYNAFASHGATAAQQAPGGAGSGAAPAGDGQSVAFRYDPTYNPPPHYPPGGGGGAGPTGPGAGGHSLIPPSFAFGQVDGNPGMGPAVAPDPADPTQLDLYLGAGGASNKGTCCYYFGYGGGGGGGFYGGGGGGTIDADLEGGGGGGGTGYVVAAATNALSETGVQQGDGEIRVTYQVPPNAGTLDVDASLTATRYDALTDGLLTLRYLFGLTGTSLTTGALGSTATRTDPAAIKTYLDGMRPTLDVDGNGAADALTDGLLIVRYLFGLRGSALIAGAVDPLATRTTAAAIETYLQSLMP